MSIYEVYTGPVTRDYTALAVVCWWIQPTFDVQLSYGHESILRPDVRTNYLFIVTGVYKTYSCLRTGSGVNIEMVDSKKVIFCHSEYFIHWKSTGS